MNRRPLAMELHHPGMLIAGAVPRPHCVILPARSGRARLRHHAPYHACHVRFLDAEDLLQLCHSSKFRWKACQVAA